MKLRLFYSAAAVTHRMPFHRGHLVHQFEKSFTDPDEVVEAMSDVAVSDFNIQPDRPQAFRLAIDVCHLRNTDLYRVSSTAARILGGKPRGGYSINIPLDAPMLLGTDESVETYGTDSALILSPHRVERLDLQFPDHQSVLVLSVFDSELDDLAVGLNGGRQEEPFRLPQRLSLETAAGKAFNRYLMFLWSEIQKDSALLQSDQVVSQLEDSLLTALIFAADKQDRGEAKPLQSVYLRRALDYIMADPSTAPSLEDIARSSGASAKTLQRAFHLHYGASVMEFVRSRRLERAHQQLLAADPSVTSVTEIAHANGFVHMSRFSAAYQLRFGELPSKTLRS